MDQFEELLQGGVESTNKSLRGNPQKLLQAFPASRYHVGPSHPEMVTNFKLLLWCHSKVALHCRVYFALWVKLCWKVVIGGFIKMIPSGPIFPNLNYFRQNIWRLSSVQFHFWHIFGTSWTQPTAAEGFTIESVSIQAGCRKDVNEVLRTSWM